MSTLPSERHVKVTLKLEDGGESHELESVWAVPERSGFRLDNIPFYAKHVAFSDVLSAVPDEDGLLRCTGVAIASGHSTVRLWFASEADVQQIRDELRAMGCASELDLSRLVAVDVPPEVSYATVRSYLDGRELAGVLEYEEGCIAHS